MAPRHPVRRLILLVAGLLCLGASALALPATDGVSSAPASKSQPAGPAIRPQGNPSSGSSFSALILPGAAPGITIAVEIGGLPWHQWSVTQLPGGALVLEIWVPPSARGQILAIQAWSPSGVDAVNLNVN